MVWKSVLAAEQLESMGVSVELINMHTIKPLDETAVLKSVKKTRCLVTAEEHQCHGGLGDAIAQVLALNDPVAMQVVAVNDSFGESGTPEELLIKYGLDSIDIVKAARKVLDRKASTLKR
jgi:transketolase